MPTTVWFIECSAPHWPAVAEALAAQNIEIALWTGMESLYPKGAAREFIDTALAKVGKHDHSGAPRRGPFTPTAQAVWEEEAQIVFDMFNRFDHSRDMGSVERQILFERILCFWTHYLETKRPDLVVFPAPPHVVYDYILLCLCRRLGIRTLMFEEATIVMPHRLEMSDYQVGDETLRAAIGKIAATSPEADKIAATLRGDYRDAIPPREVEARGTMKFPSARERKRRLLAAFVHDFMQSGWMPNTAALTKQSGLPLDRSFAGTFPRLRYARQVQEEQNTMLRWRGHYEHLSTPLDRIEGPIVYLPLAGQPERTSNPQAGIFANQQLIVRLLSDYAPPGTTVVVKEHPNQFHPNFYANMCRSEDYYREMAVKPRVRIVPTSTNPFDLIDRSIAVATTGGTAALEAVARGKPVLLFGDAWYRDCPGMIRVRTGEDVRRFFADPPTVPDDSMARFIEAVMQSCKRGMADFPPSSWVMDEAENKRNLVASILGRLERARPPVRRLDHRVPDERMA